MFILSCQKKDKEDVLILATNTTFPPFAYLGGESGQEIVGFDIELAKEIAADLGKTLKIQTMLWEEILPAIQNGKADMAIRGITITDGRKEIVNFSTIYYQTTQAALILKDDERFKGMKTKEEIGAGNIICAEKNTTGSATAKQILDAKQVVEVSSQEHMLMELLSGHVDLLLTDRDIARATVNKYKNRLDMIQLDLEVENYGIAVGKNEKELLASINTTLARLINSGKYSQLVDQHIVQYLAGN